MNKDIIQAEKKVCNHDDHQVIHLDTVLLENHELESLEQFYCPTCNCYWMEP